eukprot:826770-Pelagomonas_calceolata.AAC.4
MKKLHKLCLAVCLQKGFPNEHVARASPEAASMSITIRRHYMYSHAHIHIHTHTHEPSSAPVLQTLTATHQRACTAAPPGREQLAPFPGDPTPAGAQIRAATEHPGAQGAAGCLHLGGAVKTQRQSSSSGHRHAQQQGISTSTGGGWIPAFGGCSENPVAKQQLRA